MQKIFSPIKIKSMNLKNRLIVSAMVTRMNQPDGIITRSFEEYHLEKARGGFGLIITEDYIVNPYAGAYPNLPGLYDDSFIARNKTFTDRIHETDCKIVAQIYHSGRQSCSMLTKHVQPVAPSSIKSPLGSALPHELTQEEINVIITQFAQAARRAKESGFDGVEIHGGHGYLLHNFISPLSNKRCDKYGGNTRNRARLSVEIIKAIRDQVGEDFPIFYRMSSIENVTGGLKIEEAKAIAILLEEAGIDVLHCSQGSDLGLNIVIPPSIADKALYIDNAAEMKKVLNIPVIGVGRINDPFIAEEILRSGKADLVNMARASIADPELPNKAQHEDYDDINYCIGCLQGCMSNRATSAMTCTVNPRIGRELETKIEPVDVVKSVMVIGAGVSGCEAALIAAQRGHKVSLYEKNEKIGGQWLSAVVPVGKTDFANFLIWQQHQLEKFKVKVFLNTEVTIDKIKDESPDVVVLATGSIPFVPTALKNTNMVFAADALQGKVDVGKNILIIGGGLTGAETAEFFSVHGKKVTLIEMTDTLAGDGAILPKLYLMKALRENPITIHLNTRVLSVDEDEAVIIEKNGEQSLLGKFDTIILATGMQSYQPLKSSLEQNGIEYIVIGDAKEVRNGFYNIREGFDIGMQI